MINLNVNRIEAIRPTIERGTGLIEFPVQVLTIGGGGKGDGSTYPGGGGGGGFISASWFLPPVTTFDIQIGSGSQDTIMSYASDSSVVFNAKAGGDALQGEGEDGGSGGAGGNAVGGFTDPCIIPFRAELGFITASLNGNDYTTGSIGGNSIAVVGGGAGGGGLRQEGFDRTSGTGIIQGGAGIAFKDTFVQGLVPGLSDETQLSSGGDGVATPAGAATPKLANSGQGGDGGSSNTDGGSGLFAVTYEGLPKATGGTITQADGYTTHVFTSSAQLVVSGRSNNLP